MADMRASRTQVLMIEALRNLRMVLRNLSKIRRITGIEEIANLRNLLNELGLKQGPEVVHRRLAQTIDRDAPVRQEILMAESGSISVAEAAHKLRISKVALIKRYRNGELLAWRAEGQKAFRFPAWQFRNGQVLPGLAEVLETLDHGNLLDDLDCMLFFLSIVHFPGGKRPLDLLRNGKLYEVLRAAEAYVE